MQESKKFERQERTKEESLQELKHQIKFLEDECRFYDQGAIEYGKKIATTLRILLHDTRYSVSLFKQLESSFVYNRPDFIDLSGTYKTTIKTNIVRCALCDYRFTHDMDSSEVMTPCAKQINPQKRYPKRAFKTWWEETNVIFVNSTTSLARKDVVLLVADQDGGAHVDSKIDERLALLQRNLAIPLVIEVPMGSIVKHYTAAVDQVLYATLRAIGEEVLVIAKDRAAYCESKLN